ncbi:DUF2975 domain-containing protein [Aestuariibius sp. 2305UL40-4]|uniref:DUF2975 domain-containing protein n=1 Tax=Aestuariibius violaceus TaxID=3234132 RepID=UPI00345EE82B
MQPQDRIARLSTWLHRGTLFVLILIPFALLYVLASNGFSRETLPTEFPGVTVAEDLSATQLAMIRLVGLAPLLITLFVLDQMRRLFAAYQANRIFVAESAGHLRWIGIGLVTLAISQIIVNSIQILLLTWSNPPGQRSLTVGFSDAEIGFLLAGGFVTLIGWIMSEATRLADENRTFV